MSIRISSVAILLCFFFTGCNKSSSNNNSNSSGGTAQWTIKGVTYNSLIVSLSNNNNGISVLAAFSVPITDQVNIFFGVNQPVAGTYTVSDNNPTMTTPNLSATQCSLQAVTGKILYTSAGKAGDKVNVTIAGTSLTASFANVSIMDSTGAITTITGSVTTH